MLRKWWATIKFKWEYPYGICLTHNEEETKYYGCLSCFAESCDRERHRKREEKIEIIKEGVLRALKEHK